MVIHPVARRAKRPRTGGNSLAGCRRHRSREQCAARRSGADGSDVRVMGARFAPQRATGVRLGRNGTLLDLAGGSCALG